MERWELKVQKLCDLCLYTIPKQYWQLLALSVFVSGWLYKSKLIDKMCRYVCVYTHVSIHWYIQIHTYIKHNMITFYEEYILKGFEIVRSLITQVIFSMKQNGFLIFKSLFLLQNILKQNIWSETFYTTMSTFQIIKNNLCLTTDDNLIWLRDTLQPHESMVPAFYPSSNNCHELKGIYDLVLL